MSDTERERNEAPAPGAAGDDRTRETPADVRNERHASPPATPRDRTPFTQQLGRVVMAIAAILFGVFAVLNFESVEVNWLFTTVQTPLIAALAISFVLGALVGWGATARSRRGR